MKYALSLPLLALTGSLFLGCAPPPASGPAAADTEPEVAAAPDPEQNLKRELDETVFPLDPGEYRWYPEISPSGPVVILVSIPDQLAKVYRNGVRIGISTVSTGKTGHDTPTGVFHILEKQKTHESNLFPGAQMPNMQRLTWTGIALHAGKLPGYPASHGCVRLPEDFSAKLFEVTEGGGTVVIADELSAPQLIAHAGMVLPTTDLDTLEPGTEIAESSAELVWNPETSTEGPLAIVVSSADRLGHVYRNGTLIGKIPLEIVDPDRPLPAGVSTVLEGFSDEPNPFAPKLPMPMWMSVALPTDTTHEDYHTELVGRIRVDPEVGHQVFSLLTPGSSLVVTNLPLTADSTTTRDFVIAASGAPEPEEEAAAVGGAGG